MRGQVVRGLIGAVGCLLGALALVYFVAGKRAGAPAEPLNGTRRMVEWLAHYADTARPESGHNNDGLIAQLRANIPLTRDDQQRATMHQMLGYQLVIVGRNDEAIEQYRTAQEILGRIDQPGALAAHGKLYRNIGIASLRRGEQDNCVAAHTSESCLAPIRPDSLGVHQQPQGSTRATEAFLAALKADPDDAVSRWLLNVAYMTLGQYPARVPARWLVAPERFASEAPFPRFYDVAPYRGLDVAGHAGGVVVEDFDQDGYLDLMVSSMGLRDQLRYFHNERDGSFADWTERAGLTGIVGGLNLCHADYNNDGYPDVLALRGGWMKDDGRVPSSLMRNNGNGTFTDVTEAAGLFRLRPTQTAAWADFDGDGWLDLYIGNESWPPNHFPCELYHNNHNGTFTECARPLGLAVEGIVKGVTWGDFNNDGRPDLYISRYGQPNLLFRNDGPAPIVVSADSRPSANRAWWMFTDVSQRAGVTEPMWSFGCWFFDYDNDGWEDLMVLNLQLKNIASDYLGLPHTSDHTPRLYHNRHDGTFEDVTKRVGLDRVLPTMGCNFGDLDNDGYLDFYLGTGDPELSTLLPKRMFLNDKGKRFLDVTTAGGFGHLQKGHGVAFADFDNDGDQDVYEVMGGFFVADTAHSVLFENPGNLNHWVTVKLVGTRSNRSGVGARIQVDTVGVEGARSIYRTVSTGGSFGSSSLRMGIGLGQATSIERLTVIWPTTGLTDVYERVPMDRFITIREGDPKPKVESFKPLSLSPTRGREPPPPVCCEHKP